MRIEVMFAIVLLLPGLVQADFTLLDADFDDKTVGDPIGVGGAVLGEPIEVVTSHISAIVQDTPFDTPCLEHVRVVEGGSAWSVWEFIGGASVDVGNVFFSVDLWFDTQESFSIKLNAAGSWGSKFCEIYTTPDGIIRLSDAAGYYGVIGNFVAGRLYNLQVNLDTVADTYDVFIDGSPVVEGRSHGIVDVGVGRVSFTVSHTTVVGAELSIDNLMVTADEYTPTEAGTFSSLKPLF